MKREQLKEMNLTEEQIKSIMDLNGTDIENAKAKSGGDFEAIQQENETLKTQIADRDKDIKSLKKASGDNEDLSKQLTDLQDKYTKDTETLTQQLSQTKLNSALDTALSGSKVRNNKAAKALLDMDKIKLNDDGSLSGAEDQIKALQQSDAYLFDEGTEQNYKPKGGNGSDDNSQVQTLVDAFK